MTDQMQVIVSGRGARKTHKLIGWLLEGHKIDNAPGWSRIIIVSSTRMAEWTLKQFSSPSVLPLVLSVNQFKSLRGWSLASIEIAVDDADQVLVDLLGTRIDLISVSGEMFSQ